MNSKDYWNKRAEQRVLMGEKSADELMQTLKPVYKNTLDDITKEINAFYGRYATNNNLTLAEVHKRLDPKELKSAKEEAKKYYDAVTRLARNSNGEVDVSLLRQYKDELNLLSAKSYMSRLEELKMNLKDITVNLGIKESKAYYKTLTDVYKNNYLRTKFDTDQYLKFSTGHTLNYKTLNSAVHQRWLGRNFSERIWENKGKLLDQINTTFLQGVAQGHNPVKIAKAMAKNMNTSYSNCERLARTESAHICGESTLRTYKDAGLTKYKFLATLDNKTSDICQSLDGEVFELKDAQEGVNYPPMHPNCRSTTIPYFEHDEIDDMFDEAQRVARDDNGKLYYIPASMTYKDYVNSVNKPAENAIKYPVLVSNPKSALRGKLENYKIDELPVEPFETEMSETDIIKRLAGGDETKGSCSSLSFAYCANKAGFNVLDFRNGTSCLMFSYMSNIIDVTKLNEVKSVMNLSFDDYKGAKELIQTMQDNKEYVLVTGKHSSVVKKENGILKYLELQSKHDILNTWQPFGGTKGSRRGNNILETGVQTDNDINYTLDKRFGCQKTHTHYKQKYQTHNVLIDVESLGKNEEFIKLMRFINTASDKQVKGKYGDIK